MTVVSWYRSCQTKVVSYNCHSIMKTFFNNWQTTAMRQKKLPTPGALPASAYIYLCSELYSHCEWGQTLSPKYQINTKKEQAQHFCLPFPAVHQDTQLLSLKSSLPTGQPLTCTDACDYFSLGAGPYTWSCWTSSGSSAPTSQPAWVSLNGGTAFWCVSPSDTVQSRRSWGRPLPSQAHNSRLNNEYALSEIRDQKEGIHEADNSEEHTHTWTCASDCPAASTFPHRGNQHMLCFAIIPVKSLIISVPETLSYCKQLLMLGKLKISML